MAAASQKVKLLSSDEEEYEVPKQIAQMSVTVKNMLEDIGELDAPIPLPNVTGKILSKVIDYCKYHHEHPAPATEEKKDERRLDDIIPWDQDFCKVDQATLFELILAANYLDIKPLLDLTCKTVAAMIKGKTPEEIRKTFNIKNDFTPEEEEQMLFYSFFKSLHGKEVVVELKNDLSISGTLDSVDQYLNIKLINISVIDPESHPHMNSVKNCFIRGSVVRYVQIPKAEVDTELLENSTRIEIREQKKLAEAADAQRAAGGAAAAAGAAK